MSKPIEFPGHNVVFAKDQPEYLPLPALRMQDGEVYTCWQFTDEEWERASVKKQIYFKQLTFNNPLQPILPLVDLSDDIYLI